MKWIGVTNVVTQT